MVYILSHFVLSFLLFAAEKFLIAIVIICRNQRIHSSYWCSVVWDNLSLPLSIPEAHLPSRHHEIEQR